MKRLFNTGILALLFASSFTFAATSDNQSIISKAGQQGMEAMKDIQFARLALFRGQPDEAKKLVNTAKNLLTDEKDWSSARALKEKKTPQPDDYYVVIDSNLTLSEDFVANDEKMKAIQDANAKINKGDKKGAIEVLHLAGIDVSETQLLMPVKQTMEKVDKAQNMLNEGKYYEANLVLKGAEEGLITDTEIMVDN